MRTNQFYFKLSFVVTSVWQNLADALCLLIRSTLVKCSYVIMVLSLSLDVSCFGPQVPKGTDPLGGKILTDFYCTLSRL